VVQGECELFDVILTLQPGGRRLNPLDGREEEADHDADDRNGDEEFDEGEGAVNVSVMTPGQSVFLRRPRQCP
jgi:hypothetical protein